MFDLKNLIPKLEHVLMALAGVYRPLFPKDPAILRAKAKNLPFILVNHSETHCPGCNRHDRNLSRSESCGIVGALGIPIVFFLCDECEQEVNKQGLIKDEHRKQSRQEQIEAALAKGPVGIC